MCWILDTSWMKQTQMYICTLEEFISSWCSHIAVQLEYDILNGIYTGLHTNIWMDWRRNETWLSEVIELIVHEYGVNCSWRIVDTLVLIELQLYEKLSLWNQDMWSVILIFVLCLAPYSVNWYHHWLLISQNCWRNNWMSFLQLESLVDESEE